MIVYIFRLTIECAEEDGMRYRSAMSCLLNKDGQVNLDCHLFTFSATKLFIFLIIFLCLHCHTKNLYFVFLISFQLSGESLKVKAVMLSNLTLTPLTFRLVTRQPFWLVDLDPSSNKEGKTRTHETDMHTLKPRHNFIVSLLNKSSLNTT